MMTKTLISSALAGIIAFSLAACAQTTPEAYKPHLSVLEAELPPATAPVDIFALQGAWTGRATLLRDVFVTRKSDDPCSKHLDLTWTVNGTSISGKSVNAQSIALSHSGTVKEDGRFVVNYYTKYGQYRTISGWFNDGRAVGFLHAGGNKDYCQFRIDMTKAG